MCTTANKARYKLASVKIAHFGRERATMSALRNESVHRCQAFLFLVVLAVLLSSSWCYDPCPESLRRTSKSCNLPDSEVEKAFQQAKTLVAERKEKEKKLVREGRIVNKKIKSPESTHQQATAPPRVRELENGQLVFQEASIILTKKYKLTPEEVCCNLPKQPLRTSSASSAVQECVRNQPNNPCDSSYKYRTADGTCNNLNDQMCGSALSCFDRILPPIYTNDDGFRQSVLGGPLPQPRTLSLNVHNNVNSTTNYVNHMYMFYGQLLDHDITLTVQSMTENNSAIECCPSSVDSHPQCAPINISSTDPFYSRFNVGCLNFVRSAICPYCTAGPRVQINQVTHPIDASFVYGNSQNETNSLRENNGAGYLLRIQRSAVGDLLPQSNDPANDQCSIPAQNQICFLAGDQRVNQHPTLTSLHTAFLREHNRIATRLARMNPQWSNETVFQEGRRIVGAEMQVMTYKEYLPITLGNDRMSYFSLWVSDKSTVYNSNLCPTLYTEFSTAGFRFGHSLINTWVAEMPNRQGHSDHMFRDTFFYPFDMYTGEMDPLLRGATRSGAQYFDRYMVPDVTNFLYRIRGNSTGLDLASFNVQRGRDHGLQTYVSFVYYCSQQQIRVQSFSDLVYYELMTQDTANILQSNYRSVNDIDLFTGMLCEIWNPGAVVGPTATCIIGMQFYNLKYGDRFYYQHSGQSGSFTSSQRSELFKVSLARLLCDNSGISEMQRNAMLWPSNDNPVYPCNQIPGIDLQAWRA